MRPAIVIEDDGLFDQTYPNVIIVPLTEDAGLAIPGMSVKIPPTGANGRSKTSFALPASVTATSKTRLRQTGSCITPEQLLQIRHQLAEAIGLHSLTMK